MDCGSTSDRALLSGLRGALWSEPVVQIARQDLLPGARLALANGREFLQSSLRSLDGGLLRPAAGAFSLGTQEVGKMKLLVDAYTSGHASPDVPLYLHAAKVEAARTVLGSSALWLSDSPFQEDGFQDDAFQQGVPADEPTRLEVTYVNYGSTGWKTPPSISAADLRGHIEDALALWPTLEKLTST